MLRMWGLEELSVTGQATEGYSGWQKRGRVCDYKPHWGGTCDSDLQDGPEGTNQNPEMSQEIMKA